ncbi:AAA family ATPase [Streptosporangium sp. NPDC000239]|uniref:AAA family ATPase n=1 Tax=Streptosporangium sp. NPDC000239 TaxID=3154248 RepID=UPI0033308548
MRYTKFEFKNFKGIQHLVLPLNEGATTLIGLNESGKTTILEAIFSFSYGAESLEAINPGMASLRNPEGWIPISRRANFNDYITIRATISLDYKDQRDLRAYAAQEYDLKLNRTPSSLTIDEKYAFENSRYTPKKNQKLWDLRITGTQGRQRNPRSFGARTEVWQGLVSYLKEKLPRIWYFPDFLFELPERFDLSEVPAAKTNNPFSHQTLHVTSQINQKENSPSREKNLDRNRYYRQTFENVIERLGYGATLEAHVIGRLQSHSRHDSRILGALLLDMSRLVTATIFDGWNRIFGRVPMAQEVQIDVDVDSENMAFFEMKIKGPDGYYDLSERSLGFRWFFMFLLMTSFQKESSSESKPLILLDEPASNLHSSAQAELLKSFEKLIGAWNLVYTTHSHHLINIRWLDSSYVVNNSSLASSDFISYMSLRTGSGTSISAMRYRQFVNENPTKTSYVQPVLDLLNHQPSVLEPTPEVALVEGKSDFFVLRYMDEVIGIKSGIKIVPGGGAGSLDPLIRLHIGWGKSFIVLLDGDAEGKKQRDRYEREFGPLITDRCIMLPNICGDEKVQEMEDLFTSTDKMAIVASILTDKDPSSKVSKKEFHGALMELYARKDKVVIEPVTVQRFERLFEGLREQLQDQSKEP